MTGKRASWLDRPRPEPRMDRRWESRKLKPAADDVRCEALTTGGFNAGVRCFYPYRSTYQGCRYCHMHHPVKTAEAQAWNLYRRIEAMEAEGFVVRPAPAPDTGTEILDTDTEG